MLGIGYAPFALVTTSRVRFVPVCVAATVAPAITAPVVSVTLPTSYSYTFRAAAAPGIHAGADDREQHNTREQLPLHDSPFSDFCRNRFRTDAPWRVG